MAVALSNRAKVAGASFALFCLSLFSTAYTAKHPEVAERGASGVMGILRPVQSFYDWGYSKLLGTWTSYPNLIGVEEENAILRSRLAALEARNSELMEYKSENTRLRNLLNLTTESSLEGKAARVIGFDPSNWVQAVTVDKGASSGIAVGMPVVEGNGVVGQVVAVGPSSSRVLLITDHSSGVDAIVQNSRARGIVEGSGRNKCTLRYVLREEKLKIGERVISSGMDGVYPKGLLLGKISEFKGQATGLFQSIEIRPAVDFTKLEEVFIVIKAQPLPPPPSHQSDSE